jgi:NADPH:quinone reductase-like Zn-dependent oxidoreductase
VKASYRCMIEYPLPFIPGMDFSGIVTELGDGVTDLAVGDQVFGATPIRLLCILVTLT